VENSEQQAVTPGEMLRTAREALGISSREMADRLNWIPTHLIAVEENRCEVLRGKAFTRGYLCAYAKQVDIPETAVLTAFEAIQAAELPVAKDSLELTSESPLKKPEVSIALGLACAALLITGLWWWQSGAPPEKPAALVTNVMEDGGREVEPEQPAVGDEAGDELLVAAAEQFAATEAALEASALNEVDAEVIEAEMATPALDQSLVSPAEEADSGFEAVAGEAMLQFRFNGDCWVEIRDGNDELVYADLRGDGDSLNLDGLPPFNITLGDSTVVELRYRGEPVVITPRRGRVLARVTVGAL
jgi:cytoskeleton protein RodZ